MLRPVHTDALPADLRELLARFHFEQIPFDRLRESLAQTHPPEALHRLTGSITPLGVEQVATPPPADSRERAELASRGCAAIDEGTLAVVILAGGMATRFGASVKALAPVFEGRSDRFVDFKLRDARRFGSTVDATLMTSFATDDAIAGADGVQTHRAPQFVSMRLRASGELFLDARGRPSLHATGHGDLSAALRLAGALERYRQRGVKTIMVSNVDNLGATIDPAILGHHLERPEKITVELCAKRSGDKGGMPVLYEGRKVLAEAFRLPADFPHDAFPLFNTNTLWLDVDVLDADHDFTWCVARKQVDEREAIQFERLVGELTFWYDSGYLHVEREGSASRFVPVKDASDLAASQSLLDAVMRTRGLLRA